MPSPQMPQHPHPHPSVNAVPKLPPYASGEVAVYLGGTFVGRCDISQFGPLTATKHGVFSISSTATRYDNLSISDSSAIAFTNSNVYVYKGRDNKTDDTGSVA